MFLSTLCETGAFGRFMNEVTIGHAVRAKSSTLSIQRYLRAITPLLAVNMPSGAAVNAAADEIWPPAVPSFVPTIDRSAAVLARADELNLLQGLERDLLGR